MFVESVKGSKVNVLPDTVAAGTGSSQSLEPGMRTGGRDHDHSGVHPTKAGDGEVA